MRGLFGQTNTGFIFARVLFVLLFVVFAARAEKLPFKSYTTADGLAHDYVNEIVRDSRGFLWFCTGEGLSRFDGYEFKNYTQADGLPHRNINDLLELGDGTYLLATSAGLTLFNPADVSQKQNDQNAPPIYIEDLRVNGAAFRKLSELGETAVENLELAADERQIQIGFFALGFGMVETLRYQYRLEGGRKFSAEKAHSV